MSRENRIELINKIQELRGSNVLVYFTGDRQPIGSRIAEDAVRPCISISWDWQSLQREDRGLICFSTVAEAMSASLGGSLP